MKINKLSDDYSVSAQITVEDVQQIKEAGFSCIICNRPDEEIPPALHANVMEEASREAGLDFYFLPLTHQSMTPQNIAKQMEYMNAGGTVLAYCASGTRCSVVWSIAQASQGVDVDTILQTTERAGYPLEALRTTLESIKPA